MSSTFYNRHCLGKPAYTIILNLFSCLQTLRNYEYSDQDFIIFTHTHTLAACTHRMYFDWGQLQNTQDNCNKSKYTISNLVKKGKQIISHNRKNDDFTQEAKAWLIQIDLQYINTYKKVNMRNQRGQQTETHTSFLLRNTQH